MANIDWSKLPDQGIDWSGLPDRGDSWGVEDTLRGAGAVLGGIPASIVGGLAGTAKFITSGGDIEEAQKTLEGVSSIPNQILTTERQRQAAGKVGEVMMYPFKKAGELTGAVGRATGIPYAEPVLGTVGEAGSMFAVPGAVRGGKSLVKKGVEAVKGKEVVEPRVSEFDKLVAEYDLENLPDKEIPRTIEPKIDLENLPDKEPTPAPKAEAVQPEIIPEQAKVEAPKIEEPVKVEPEPVKAEEPAPIQEAPAVETPSLEGTTGVKRSVVDEERAARGLDPIETTARSKDPNAWDEAKNKVDTGEIDPRQLAKDVVDTPRTLSGEEVNALLYDRMKLQNEHAKVQTALEDAQLKGDAVAEAKLVEERTRIEEAQDTLDNAARINSTSWHDTGMAMQKMINEDYSLSAVLRRARSDNGGKPLTDAQRAKYEGLAKQIEEANTKIAEYQERISSLEAEKTVKQLKNQVARENRQLKRSYAKADLKTEFDGLLQELNKQLGGQLSAGVDPTAAAILGKMAVNRVKSGIHSAAGIVDHIYTELKNIGLEISKRDIRDAISGYGKTTQMSKEALNVELRELRRQMRLTSALEDAQGGKSPLRSGLQRDNVSDTVRELTRKVQLAMKEAGIDASKLRSPEERWKTSLDAIKTRLRNEISDLAKGVERNKKQGIPYDREAEALQALRNLMKEADPVEKKVSAELLVKNAVKGLEDTIKRLEDKIQNVDLSTVKKEIKTPQTEKIKELQGRRERLQAILDGMRRDNRTTKDPQVAKVENAIKAVEKSITEYERRIKENDLAPKKKVSTTPETPELKGLRDVRDRLKRTYQEMVKESKPKLSPDEIALKSFKTRTTNRIAELEKRIAEGNFTTKPKREWAKDKEALTLDHNLQIAKEKYNRARFNDQQARRTTLKKGIDLVADVVNTSRAIMTSFDFSAVLRQGGFIVMGHPIRGLKTFPAMFKALTKKGEFAVEREIKNRPSYKKMQDAGLYLAEHGEVNLAKMEEAYMSRHAEKIPGVGASQRAYTTFLNKLRADSFDIMVNKLAKKKAATPEEMKAIANYINVATGRGKLPGKEGALVGLNTVFFAPRLVASRFNLVAGQPLWRGSARTRTAVAKEYGRFLAGIGTVYTLAKMMGGEVETDPRSADFGKIRIGNTRIDPLSGLSQATVLIGRLGSGETKTMQGDIKALSGEEKEFGTGNQWDVITRFMRTKLSPAVGAGVNVATGVDVTGQPVTAASTAANLMVPMTFQDIYKAMEEQGVPQGAALGILSTFGAGLQTYQERD